MDERRRMPAASSAADKLCQRAAHASCSRVRARRAAPGWTASRASAIHSSCSRTIVGASASDPSGSFARHVATTRSSAGGSDRLHGRRTAAARASRIAAISAAWLLPVERAPSGRASRRAPRRTRRCRCARRPPCPRAAPAPCTGTCRGSCPARSARPASSAAVDDRPGDGATPRAWRGRSRAASRPILRQHDVARLQVAVDDAGAVRRVERVGDLRRAMPQRLVERQRAARRAARRASRPRGTP